MDLRFITPNSNERRYEFACDWRIGDNHRLSILGGSNDTRGNTGYQSLHAAVNRSQRVPTGDQEILSKLKAALTLARLAASSC